MEAQMAIRLKKLANIRPRGIWARIVGKMRVHDRLIEKVSEERARICKARHDADGVHRRAEALEARRRNVADLVAFGRLYIANPDLVERLRVGAPLNVPDQTTFFGGDREGYIDYPTLTPAKHGAA